MKEYIDTNTDMNLALLQVRSTPLGATQAQQNNI